MIVCLSVCLLVLSVSLIDFFITVFFSWSIEFFITVFFILGQCSFVQTKLASENIGQSVGSLVCKSFFIYFRDRGWMHIELTPAPDTANLLLPILPISCSRYYQSPAPENIGLLVSKLFFSISLSLSIFLSLFYFTSLSVDISLMYNEKNKIDETVLGIEVGCMQRFIFTVVCLRNLHHQKALSNFRVCYQLHPLGEDNILDRWQF